MPPDCSCLAVEHALTFVGAACAIRNCVLRIRIDSMPATGVDCGRPQACHKKACNIDEMSGRKQTKKPRPLGVMTEASVPVIHMSRWRIHFRRSNVDDMVLLTLRSRCFALCPSCGKVLLQGLRADRPRLSTTQNTCFEPKYSA